MRLGATNRRIAVLVLWMLIFNNSLVAQAESGDLDGVVGQLIHPMNSIVDGKPLRQAIHRIADQAGVNVWIDRRVNPSLLVSLGPIGPTAFAALDQLAKSCECVVMPVGNVVLFGRKEWVDQTATAVMLLQLDHRSPKVNISWDDLTTPTEALAIAADQNVGLEPALPHDLWPAVNWRDMDRRVAVTLVLAQFDRRPISTESISRLSTEPASAIGQLTFRYKLSAMSADFRKAFLASDRSGRVNLRDGTISARGSIAAHRKAIRAVLAAAKPESQDLDRSVFTIKRMRTSAHNAFNQLAKMAGRTCRIDASAQEACQGIISVEGKDLTLRELTDRVAAEAGVLATWTADTIVITAPVVNPE